MKPAGSRQPPSSVGSPPRSRVRREAALREEEEVEDAGRSAAEKAAPMEVV